MAQPIRRMQPGTAVARGVSSRTPPPTPARRKPVEEVGRGFVATQAKDGRGVYHEEDKELEVLRTQFDEGEHPAFVKVGAGMTINQGNFESLRIDCSVTVPCTNTEDGIQKAYEFASDFVADKIAEEQTAWLGAPQQKAKK